MAFFSDRLLEELRHLAGALPPPVPLAGLTCIAVAIVDLARQYVRQRFNCDIDRKHFVPGGVGPQLTPEGEIPLSRSDMDTFVAACQDAALCESMLLAGLDALWGAQQLEGKAGIECMQEAVAAMLTILQSLPLFVGPLMESPVAHQQEQGTLSVAGWAVIQMSLKHNRRLRQVLAHDDIDVAAPMLSEFATLLEQLPAHTYAAWHQEGWSTLEELRTSIASLMGHDGVDLGPTAHLSPDSLRQLQQSREHPTRDNPTYEDVARKLEEEDLYTVWFKQAKLTPYEEAVAQLQLQDYSDQQIVDRLNRSLNAIQQAWLSARKKLRQVMGS